MGAPGPNGEMPAIANLLKKLAHPARFELTTSAFGGQGRGNYCLPQGERLKVVSARVNALGP